MTNKSLSLAISLSIAAISITANAAIVDHGTYLTDTNSGLDWLDVTASVGRSFNDVSSQFGAGGDFAGWRYATGQEFNALVSHTWGSSTVSPSNYSLISHPMLTVPSPFWVTYYAGRLVPILGSTLDAYYLDAYGLTYDQFYPVGNDKHGDTLGMLADVVPTGGIHTAKISFVGIFDNNGWLADEWDVYYTTEAHSTISVSNGVYNDRGSYLVRTSLSAVTAPVPEPETYAMMLAGLGLLVGMARRRKAEKQARTSHVFGLAVKQMVRHSS